MFCKHCGNTIRETPNSAVPAESLLPSKPLPRSRFNRHRRHRIQNASRRPEHVASTESPNPTESGRKAAECKRAPRPARNTPLLALGVAAVLLIGIAVFSMKYLKSGLRPSDHPTASGT